MQLTGIAAILRFPMPDIEDEILSDSEDDSDDAKSNGDEPPKGAQANGFDATANDTVTPKPPQVSTLKPNSSNASFTTNSDQPLKNPTVSTLANAESGASILHKTPSKSSLKSEPASGAASSGKSSPLPMATG